MKIKKFMAMMIAAATLCGGFYSCSDDEEEAPSSSNQDQKPDKNPAANDSTANGDKIPAKQDSTSNGGQTNNVIPAELIAGKYNGTLVFNVMGKEIPNEGAFVITKADNNHVNIQVPSTTFMNYVIPTLSINNVEVSSTGDAQVSGTLDKYEGSVEVEGEKKTYSLSNIVVKNTGADLEMSCVLKYGAMPMDMNCSFTGKK